MMIDIGIVVFILLFIAIGYYRGFVWQILNSVRLVIVIVFIYFFSQPITNFFKPMILPYIVPLFEARLGALIATELSNFLIVLLLPSVFSIVFIIFSKNIIKVTHGKVIKKIPIVGQLNAMLGALIGLLIAFSVTLLLVALIENSGINLYSELLSQSMIVSYISKILPDLINLISQFWNGFWK